MSTTGPTRFRPDGGPVFEIRSLREADAARVLACRKAEAGTSPFLVSELDEITDTEAEQAEWIRARAASECDLALGAFVADPGRPEEGLCVGTCVFATHKPRRLRHRGMFGISVLAGYRGRGLGTAMIGHMLEWARAHPVVEIVGLGAFHTNTRALALYERLGFEREAVRRDFFRIEGAGGVEYADDVIMTMRVG